MIFKKLFCKILSKFMISVYVELFFVIKICTNTSTGQEFLGACTRARIFDMTESFLLENPLKRCKNALKTVQGRRSCLVLKSVSQNTAEIEKDGFLYQDNGEKILFFIIPLHLIFQNRKALEEKHKRIEKTKSIQEGAVFQTKYKSTTLECIQSDYKIVLGLRWPRRPFEAI